MGHVTTLKIWPEWPGTKEVAIKFEIRINVTSAGEFTTVLPKEAVDWLESFGVTEWNYTLRSKPVHLSGHTLKELEDKVWALCRKATERELLEDILILRYNIATAASYCLTPDGVLPCPYWAMDRDARWSNGTVVQHSSSHYAYGIQVYCEPFQRRRYRYNDGKERTFYDRFRAQHLEVPEPDDPQYNLKWISALCAQDEPPGKLQEIEYTETNALFFVNLFRSIAMINERIKDHLHPDAIRELAARGGHLLGAPNPTATIKT